MPSPTDPQQERIAALEAELAACTRDGQRLSQLLAEAEDDTEALEAALRALVDKDVEGDAALAWTNDGPPCPHCRVPGGEWQWVGIPGWNRWRPAHAMDCPVRKARELLKGEG